MNHLLTTIKESWAERPFTTFFGVSGLTEIALAWPVGMFSLNHGVYTLFCGGICLFIGVSAMEFEPEPEDEEDGGGGLELDREQAEDRHETVLH